MARNKETEKPNIMMCIACVLFCLTLISAYMTSGLYAKYTVTSNGRDLARVIKFGDIVLTESGDFGIDGTLMIIPDVDLTKKAVLSFDGSEASTYVFVKITPSPHWTTTDNRNFAIRSENNIQMQWTVADEWVFLEHDSSGRYLYYQELAPNTPLKTDIIANDGHIIVSDTITKRDIAGMNGIFIDISAAAVQNNGFADPTAAWESMASKKR